jgi:hypothetical protein
MGKHPQNRFRRLAIVGPPGGKSRPQFSGPRWWGPRRQSGFGVNQASQTAQAQAHFKSIRMAVMPTLTRGLWFEAIVWIWNLLRSYFVRGTERQRGAVILSFSRHAARVPSFRRRAANEAFVTKKASGSVCWNRDREVAPKEGGIG